MKSYYTLYSPSTAWNEMATFGFVLFYLDSAGVLLILDTFFSSGGKA